MTHQGTQTITTQRLILRRLQTGDAQSLFECGSLGKTPEEAKKMVSAMAGYYKDADNYNWVLEFEGKAVGRIKVIEISPRDHYMQVAYDIGKAYRNRGLMTEALRGVINYLFSRVGVHRIYGQCRVHNIPSARVLQKAGMTHEGRLRKHFAEGDGSYSDVDIYGMIREEWEKC